MARRTVIALLLATALLASACGGDAGAPGRNTVAGAAGDAPPKARPALARAPKQPGEILVQGDVSPGSHGPFALDGRYTARFEQIAPENPTQDFTTQTAFVAVLDKRSQVEDGTTIRMFRAAARTGRKEITARGRYFIDVSFGDYPYAVRLTPAGQR
jgi:hypothetical protein